MNSNKCSENQHISFAIGKCTHIRCGHDICQACYQNHEIHKQFIQLIQIENLQHNMTPKQQNFQNKNNNMSPLDKQISMALINFDQQFENRQQKLIEFLNSERQNMRIQFEQYLRDDLSNLQKFVDGKIEPIEQLFDCIQNNLENQYSKNSGVVNIDFTQYLDKYGIPDFMREQLKKFKFESNEFENVQFQDLVEEDNPKTLIIGQKDANNQFSGRALIIYKSDPAAIYLGYLKNKKRHGKGILVLNGFQYYMGDYYDNQEWGYGEIQFINKDKQNEKFVGYFSEGKRCGQGQSRILDTFSNKETTYVFVNYFNETLHGSRVNKGQFNNSFSFELFQYEKNYFSFKDQWSDKAQLKQIPVTTKGITEGQALNKSNNLEIDSSFKENQFQDDQNPYFIQSPNNLSPQNLYPPQQQYYSPPPPQLSQPPYNYLPPQQGFPIHPQQYAQINPQQQFQANPNYVYQSQIQKVIFDKMQQN
ncbi:hypothetical protein ABPG74_019969 [Tetrahymena malaccensis]